MSIEMDPIDVNIIEWVFVLIAIIFFVLRIYVRNSSDKNQPYRRKRTFRCFSIVLNRSDMIITFALLCFIATLISNTVMVVIINGFHDPALSLDPTLEDPESAYLKLPKAKMRDLLEMLFAVTFPHYTCLWCPKFYLVCLYYHIIPEATMPTQRFLLHILAFLVYSSYFVWFGIYMFWCVPISSNWEVDDPRDVCVAYYAFTPFNVANALHMGTEALIFALPFTFLHTLRSNNRRQFRAVAAMFSFGFIGVLITAGKIGYIYVVSKYDDPVINFVLVWASAEACFGIIMCCLPAFKKCLGMRLRKTRDEEGGYKWKLRFSIDYVDDLERRSGSNSWTAGSGGEYVDVRMNRKLAEDSGSSSMGRIRLMGHERRVIDPEEAILRVESFEKEVAATTPLPDAEEPQTSRSEPAVRPIARIRQGSLSLVTKIKDLKLGSVRETSNPPSGNESSPG